MFEPFAEVPAYPLVFVVFWGSAAFFLLAMGRHPKGASRDAGLTGLMALEGMTTHAAHAAGEETVAGRAQAEDGVGGGHAQVARDRQLEPAADGITVQRVHHRVALGELLPQESSDDDPARDAEHHPHRGQQRGLERDRQSRISSCESHRTQHRQIAATPSHSGS